MKTKLLTTLTALLIALSAWANGVEIDGIYYLLDSSTKTASVTSGSTKYQGDIIIPPTVTYEGTTYSVTSIGGAAFWSCSGLTSITIPNSVTSIGEAAFYFCTGLTSITIPASVTSIGESAFSYCTSLTSIKVAAGNTTYDSRDNCNAIIETASNTLVAGCKTTTIPSSVTSIGLAAFYGCTRLTSITIPSSVTSIGDGAFSYCTSLTSIKVEAGNTKYDSRDNCNAIIETASNTLVAGCKATTIPSSVTSIGDYTFYRCSGLTRITIPSSVTSIGDYAFEGCTGLTSITIPNSVTTIGDSAFSDCTGLTSITIPSSVTTLGRSAFWRCTGLTSITIPASVTSIGESAFSYCTGLTSIKVAAGNTTYDSRDNCNAIIETASNTLVAGCKATTIPSSVTTIGDRAFEDCSGLTSITIPNSVTTLGRSAFWRCTGLTSITIPESVTSIGWWAFNGCSGLKSITVESSDPEAYNCEPKAFEEVPTSTCTLHVPKGCKEAYASTAPWSNFASIVDDIDTGSDDAVVLTADGEDVWTDGVLRFSVSSEKNGEAVVSGVKDKDNLGAVTIPEKVKIADKVYSVTSIGKDAFYGCTGLTSITIPESVKSIGNWAFYNCTGLTSITIPSSVTTIGNSAFDGCTGLASITIPESVTSIGEYAFQNCTGLTSITIPSSVTSIGNSFYGCTGLTSITIPSSVTSIGSGVFSGCTGLTSIKVEAGNTKYDSRDNCNAIIETAGNTLVAGCKTTTIPSSVTSIGSSAFSRCTGLTSLTIPSSVTSIGDGAFRYCTGLTSITIPSSVTSIGSSAFSRCTGLTSITIPSSVTSIGDMAFLGCTGLTSITIPSSVTSIGSSAFSRCTGLTSITIPSSVTSIGDMAFYGCTDLTSITACKMEPSEYNCSTGAFYHVFYSSVTLYVPAGSASAYRALEPWSNFSNIVETDLTSIQTPTINSSETIVGYYNLQGQRIAEPQHGIVIVRYSDGTSRKMYVR